MQFLLGHQAGVLLIVGSPAGKSISRNLPKNLRIGRTCRGRTRCPSSTVARVSCRNPGGPPCRSFCCSGTYHSGVVLVLVACGSCGSCCSYPSQRDRCFERRPLSLRWNRRVRGRSNLKGVVLFAIENCWVLEIGSPKTERFGYVYGKHPVRSPCLTKTQM